MVVAATVGTIIPLILRKLDIDPAIATGPFVTTSIDILGVLFYFLIAGIFLKYRMELFLLFGAGSYYCFIVMIISGLLFRERTSAKYEQSLPFTTVVIAARNEENNLPSLLDDLVNQKIDKNKFEVIIANDRSVDNTEEIINEYSNKYKFIKAIHIIKKLRWPLKNMP